MVLSKKELRRLADRLRNQPSAADLAVLEQYKDAHLGALAHVLQRLYGLTFVSRVAISARQKNTGTILEKLRRQSEMELGRIQDIVGVRIVLHGGRKEQTSIVEELMNAFGESTRKKDRRDAPSSGYRAVHVIVRVDGFHCEIQVRTPYQDRWAQLFEGIGDRWGRQIRYGQPPNGPDAAIDLDGVAITRAEVVQEMLMIADEISDAERYEESVQQLSPADYEIVERFGVVNSFFKALSCVVPDDHPPTLHFTASTPSTPAPLHAFLLAYQRSRGTLLKASAYADADLDRAIDDRKELAEAYRNDADVEVVLLKAGSEETLRKTHSRYFERLGELANVEGESKLEVDAE